MSVPDRSVRGCTSSVCRVVSRTFDGSSASGQHESLGSPGQLPEQAPARCESPGANLAVRRPGEAGRSGQRVTAQGWSGAGQGTRLSVRLAALGGYVDEREFNETVAQLIREARMRAGVTQEYVGRRAGLTRGSITNIESGTQSPPLYRLALIAAAVNADPADLLPSLHLDEASGLAARHAADVAAVWAQASKIRGVCGEG
ncbi:hypothetical protein C3492_25195 [Streptomyces sp. Ru62]|nr:hypothetical protein C3492_25195 [Streptomyces sp. Ru62]